MSTSGIIGTLAIYLDDGNGEQEVVSLLSATLSVETKMRSAFNPTYVAGTQAWRADASVLQMMDTATEEPEEYLSLIKSASVNGTLLDVVFESPTGATYTSQAYIDNFQVGGAHQEGFAGAFGVQGAAELVLAEGA